MDGLLVCSPCAVLDSRSSRCRHDNRRQLALATQVTPATLRAHLGLSVADMAQLVGVTRQGWYKIERSGQPSLPVASLLAYILEYGPELAKEMMEKGKIHD